MENHAASASGVWLILFTRSAMSGLAVFGLGLLVVRIWKTSRFVSGLLPTRITTPQRLGGLCAAFGLSRHVVLLATDVPLAFCFGWLRPRICLSTGLVDALSDGELKAVLLHEDHHRRRRDPLRGLLVEAIGRTFFFLPVVTELRDLFLLSTELDADRYAARLAGRPSLAGALHKLLTHPLVPRLPVLGVVGFSATSVRIAELLGDRPTVLRLSGRSLVITSAVLLLGCMIAPGPLF